MGIMALDMICDGGVDVGSGVTNKQINIKRINIFIIRLQITEIKDSHKSLRLRDASECISYTILCIHPGKRRCVSLMMWPFVESQHWV